MRHVLLAWTLVWLCGMLSLDLLHDSEHFFDSSSHHTCLVCQVGQQPAVAEPSISAASLIAPVYVVTFCDLPDVLPFTHEAQPQPHVPRGPPL